MHDMPGEGRLTSNVTVDRVREFVERAGKDWALVITGDGATTQYTTWGRDPDHKVFAGDFAEEISAWINAGWSSCLDPATGPATVMESYKLDAAKNKAALERLREACKGALALLRRFPGQTALPMRQDELMLLQGELARKP